MRKIYLILFAMLPLMLFSQQEPQYSQYMFNGYVLNPAYAGSREALSGTAIYRMQWTGMEDAPRTGSFGLHTPSKNRRHGFGLSFVHDEAGPIKDMSFSAGYAFRIPLGKGNIALGLQASARNYRISTLNLRRNDDLDPVLTEDDFSRWVPNVNTGVYLSYPRFYAGVSAMQLIPNRLSNLDGIGNSRESMHMFATVGGVINLGEFVKFKPSALMKYAPNTFIQFDINASFLFKERVWVGVSYRTINAMVFLAEIQVIKQIRVGYAYDLSLSKIRLYNSGSHEIMLGFDLDFGKKGVTSPRYF